MPGFPIPLPVFIGAAVIDSINPCAFGVLIFLLSYLLENTGNKVKMFVHGMTYVLGVFLTYLIAGIVLLPVIGQLGGFSRAIYIFLAIVVIISGLTEIKDFFWYGKGFSLTLLPGSSERIKMYAKRISTSLWSAFGLGVFVAFVELPCTGAVYLAVLSIMSLAGVDATNITMLILYNLIFVAPLVVIILLFVLGIKSEVVEKWRQAHKAYMRLMIGAVLLGLGVWMLVYAI